MKKKKLSYKNRDSFVSNHESVSMLSPGSGMYNPHVL